MLKRDRNSLTGTILDYQIPNSDKNNPHKVWDRSDVAFFSAGACHILAFEFLSLYPEEGFRPYLIRPSRAQGIYALWPRRGTHVYVSNGEISFHSLGYSRDPELVESHLKTFKRRYKSWEASITLIEEDIIDLCRRRRLRQPQDFLFDPTERARKYISRFPSPDQVRL